VTGNSSTCAGIARRWDRKLAGLCALQSPATDPESADFLDVLARFRCIRDYTHDVPSILRYFRCKEMYHHASATLFFFSPLFFLIGDVGQAKVVEPGWSKLSP
jgi:hypothetical protein